MFIEKEDNSPHFQEQETGEQYMDKGTIRCARRSCGKERSEQVCPHCGNATCLVQVWWKGKHWKIRRYRPDGKVLDYTRAKDVHAAIRLQVNYGTFNPSDWIVSRLAEKKFEEQINKWLDDKQEIADDTNGVELSYETIRCYRSYSKKHIIPFFQKYLAGEVREPQLREFVKHMRKTVQSIKYRRDIMNALHNFFEWLHQESVILNIPAWPKIKGNNSKERQALDEDAQALGLSRIPVEHRDVIEFGMMTGRRPGELCAFQVQDGRPDDEEILVCRTWSGSRIRVTTKQGEKIAAPMVGRAIEIFEKHKHDKMPGAFLFINPETGRPYRPKFVNNVWKAYSGLPGTVFYEAGRHSFCTQIGKIDGVTLKDQQNAMGHRVMQTTMKYTHKTLKRVADILKKKAEVTEIRKAKERHDSGTTLKAVNQSQDIDISVNRVEPAVRIEMTARKPKKR